MHVTGKVDTAAADGSPAAPQDAHVPYRCKPALEHTCSCCSCTLASVLTSESQRAALLVPRFSLHTPQEFKPSKYAPPVTMGEFVRDLLLDQVGHERAAGKWCSSGVEALVSLLACLPLSHSWLAFILHHQLLQLLMPAESPAQPFSVLELFSPIPTLHCPTLPCPSLHLPPHPSCPSPLSPVLLRDHLPPHPQEGPGRHRRRPRGARPPHCPQGQRRHRRRRPARRGRRQPAAS